jgi:hypothetical protein
MSALYLLHILYNVLSIKMSDSNVYMIHIHMYRSVPIWLDILYTQITGDNSLYKILTPNITYTRNKLFIEIHIYIYMYTNKYNMLI